MGTTSEKLTYLNTTKTLIKDNLNLGGANISNEPFRVYSSKLIDIYKDFLANGTDTLWNNWNKVNGTGESLTLNNTIKAKMDFVYKGNTSQSILPSGYTQVDYIESSGTQYIDLNYIYNEGDIIELEFMPLEANVDKAIFGAYEDGSPVKICELGFINNFLRGNVDTASSPRYSINDVYKVKNINGQWKYNDEGFGATRPNTMSINCYLFARNYNGVSKKSGNRVYYLKITRNNAIIHNYIPCYRNSDNEVGMYDLVSNTFYTNSGTGTFTYGSVAVPTPDTPIPVNVVTGDNTIKVEGKNLFGKTARQGNVANKTIGDRLYFDNVIYVHQGETYTISTNLDTSSFKYAINISTVETPRPGSANWDTGWKTTSPLTFTAGIDGYLGIPVATSSTTGSITPSSIENVWWQLEEGSTATSYVPYEAPATYSINLGSIELCKIGDYQDSIKKSSGKNLFDGELELGTYNGNTGEKLSSNDTYRNANIIKVQPNTTYTFSINGTSQKYVMYYYNGSKTFISVDTSLTTGTFTTPNNAYYINFRCFGADFTNNYANLKIMLNEGSTALPYEPYGTGEWYLEKKIGKVVLDGSETWSNAKNITDTNIHFSTTIIDGLNIPNYGMSNYFSYVNNLYNTDISGFAIISNSYNLRVRIPATLLSDISSISQARISFTNWLSTHNTSVYYVLATPTITPITDTNLINQLEAIKSVNGQTNISQENDNLPFELDVTALGELEI